MKYNTLMYRVLHKLKRELRNRSNPYLAPYRLNHLIKKGIRTDFSIISNNCWGGLVYQHYGLPYSSPTVGLFFFATDYIKFVYDIKSYLQKPLEFIPLEKSKYRDTLIEYGGECIKCPIAICGDIEIIFMHYHTVEEAKEKWERRTARINWDNVIYKFSEMNHCSEADLMAFDGLPVKNKVVFTHKDYHLFSQCIYKEFSKEYDIPNDTDSFNKYIKLDELLGGNYKFRKL